MKHLQVVSNRPLTSPSPTPLACTTLVHSPKDRLANLLGCFAQNGTLGHPNISHKNDMLHGILRQTFWLGFHFRRPLHLTLHYSLALITEIKDTKIYLWLIRSNEIPHPSNAMSHDFGDS